MAAALDVLEGLFLAVGLNVGALFNNAHSRGCGSRGGDRWMSCLVRSLRRPGRDESWMEEALSACRLVEDALFD